VRKSSAPAVSSVVFTGRRAGLLLLALMIPALTATAALAAGEEKSDGTTNLPVPRFVSLKSNTAMMRTGPDDRRFPIQWEYKRRGLPMEVVREYGIWRQVRDPDGTIGWMNKSLLTGERTGYVIGSTRTLYTSPDLQSRVAWRIEPGTVVTITLCENVWCRVSNGGRSGYILRNQIWGTYPNEAIGG
jgi:SH3-like domain-containing protein